METEWYQFAVAGGDMRQWYLAKILAESGHRVMTYALCEDENIHGTEKADSWEAVIQKSDVLILPVPVFKEKRIHSVKGTETCTAERLQKNWRSGQMIVAGCIPKEIKEAADEQGVILYDWLTEKEMAVRNSVAAAEGILAEAITRSPKNLNGSQCVVLGYGTCGKMLVSLLRGFSCEIQIYEKSQTEEELDQMIGTADFIFNTAPAMVLTRERLLHVKEDAWILDMASAPGGVDYISARELGVQAVLLPGLPGRYAPLTSAQIIADSILQNIRNNSFPDLKIREQTV